MKKVRVGIVGSRFAARIHVDGYKRCPEVEVVAVASPNVDHVRSFIAEHNIPQCYTDYREMFRKADIDLVSVCVPNYLHRDVTISAAEAGKHVICEKPLATSLKDAGEMVEVCEKNDVKLMYAEDWLFSPILTRAKEICQEGAVGQVLYLKAKETHSGSHSIFAKRLNYCGGGAMIHLGIHPIGFARWFKQKEVVEVSGRVSGGGKANLLHPDFEGEDWGAAILTFEDGSFCLIEANYITLGGLDDQVEIYGTKGSIRVNLSQGSPMKVFSLEGYQYAVEKAETTKGWTFPAVDEDWSLGYPQELAHFIDCVRYDKEPMWGARGEDGLRTLEVVFAIYKSSGKGRSIKLGTGSHF